MQEHFGGTKDGVRQFHASEDLEAQSPLGPLILKTGVNVSKGLESRGFRGFVEQRVSRHPEAQRSKKASVVDMRGHVEGRD